MGQGNGAGTMMVMAIVKGMIAVMLVAIVGYSVVAEIELPGVVVKLVFTVLACYFGLSARIYEVTAREIKARHDQWKRGGGI